MDSLNVQRMDIRIGECGFDGRVYGIDTGVHGDQFPIENGGETVPPNEQFAPESGGTGPDTLAFPQMLRATGNHGYSSRDTSRHRCRGLGPGQTLPWRSPRRLRLHHRVATQPKPNLGGAGGGAPPQGWVRLRINPELSSTMPHRLRAA